jgi:hypothetical protein
MQFLSWRASSRISQRSQTGTTRTCRGRDRPQIRRKGRRPRAGDDRVRKAVEIAWSKMLDRASFEMGKSWSEGGGDSLKAMELIFLIERALDFRVPL